MEFKEGYLVCSNELKKKILLQQKTFKDYSFLTLEELKAKLSFMIGKKALLPLMKEYNFSYDLAQDYLNACEWIEDKNYNDPHLDSVVSVLHYLKQNNFIEKDLLFALRLKNYPLTFLEPNRSLEYLKIKKMAGKITAVEEISYFKKQYSPVIYEYETLQEECLAVFNEIKKLQKKGVPLSKIFIINASDDYLFLFKRLAKSYNITVDFKPTKDISCHLTVRKFMEMVRTENDFAEIFAKLDKNDYFYSKLLNLVNDYGLTKFEPKECLELLTRLIKNQDNLVLSHSDAVRFADISIYLNSDEYAFFVGFNLGSAPKIIKEDGFLNSRHKEILGLSTANLLNEIENQKLINFLMTNQNVFVSFKRMHKTEEFIPSTLIEELNLPVEVKEVEYGYAKTEDDLRLVAAYDHYLKYNSLSEDLALYGLNGLAYKAYDHTYKPLPQILMEERFKVKPLKLAYSNVKLYYACPFSYYADRILNLNEFKPQMAARLGTYAHAVLEESYEADFDFDRSCAKNSLEYSTDAKDDFFFQQMNDVLRRLIAFNQRYEAASALKEIKREQHIVVDSFGYTFEGFIDKMLYSIQGDNVYVAIIDYKTGKDVLSLDNIADGFNLQLPSYMYLLANYEPFKGLNLHIIGIYLQKVNIVILNSKSFSSDDLDKQFQLEGYTIEDQTLIPLLDADFANSTYIKSLGLTKSGFRAYSKVFKSDSQNFIIALVKDLLDKASLNIKAGDFKIAPKVIKGINKSCRFCNYKDLCFYDYDDEVELEEKPFGKGENANGLD